MLRGHSIHRRVWALALGLSACAAAGCISPPSSPSNAVQIGALFPYTGDLAGSGSNIERGALLALERLNRAGGVEGRPLRLEPRDTHSDTARGLEAGRELLEVVGVDAVIGPEDVDLAYQMVALVRQRDIVQLSSAESPQTLAPNEAEYWFRLFPSVKKVGSALATRIRQDGVQKVALLFVDDTYGSVFSDVVGGRLRALGVEVAPPVAVVPGSASYVEPLREALASNPQAIVLVAQPSTGASIVQEWALMGESQRWYLAPSLRADAFVQNVPPAVLQGMVGVAVALPADSEDFAEDFRQRWSEEDPLSSAYAYYDAVAILGLALEAATLQAGGAPTGAQLREQILEVAGPAGVVVTWEELDKGLEYLRRGEDINYRGASGTVDFDSTGEVLVGLVQFWGIEGGKIVVDPTILVQ